MGGEGQRAHGQPVSLRHPRGHAQARAGLHNDYDERGTIVARRRPPRFFKLSYLITAWTKRPEDEHRLLSSLLGCLLRYEALPPERLAGTLAEIGAPVPMSIALPPPEDRSFADVWSALGGELKPSLDLVVSVPVTASPSYVVGPPVGDEGLRTRFGDVPEVAEPVSEPMPGRAGLPVYGGRPGRPGGGAASRIPDAERRRGLSLRITETRKARDTRTETRKARDARTEDRKARTEDSAE